MSSSNKNNKNPKQNSNNNRYALESDELENKNYVKSIIISSSSSPSTQNQNQSNTNINTAAAAATKPPSPLTKTSPESAKDSYEQFKASPFGFNQSEIISKDNSKLDSLNKKEEDNFMPSNNFDEDFKEFQRDENYKKKYIENRNSRDDILASRNSNKGSFRQKRNATDDEQIEGVNFDRDDSLYDVLSIGKQTPFRQDFININLNNNNNEDDDENVDNDYQEVNPDDYNNEEELNELRNDEDYEEEDEENLNSAFKQHERNNEYDYDDDPRIIDKVEEENMIYFKQDDSNENINDPQNRYSLVNFEYLQNDNAAESIGKENVRESELRPASARNKRAGSSNRFDDVINFDNSALNKNELLIDLKDTSIDEILLIADDSTSRIGFEKNRYTEVSPNQIQKSQQSPAISRSRIPTSSLNTPRGDKSSRSPSKQFDTHRSGSRGRESPSRIPTSSANVGSRPSSRSNLNSFNLVAQPKIMSSKQVKSIFLTERESNESLDNKKKTNQNNNSNYSNEQTKSIVQQNIDKIREKINSLTNYGKEERKADALFELMQTPQPDLIADEEFNIAINANNKSNNNSNKTSANTNLKATNKSNEHGAFKFYNISANDHEQENSLIRNEKDDKLSEELSNPTQFKKFENNNSKLNTANSKSTPTTSRMSPFISIDKPDTSKSNSNTTPTTNSSSLSRNEKNASNNQLKQPTTNSRGSTKKYRSGSTSSIHAGKNKTLSSNSTKSNLDQKDERYTEGSRPSTQHEVTYSLDSDESIVVDNLINNPIELKEKLKQGKVDREQLAQLQENYLRLLEQYAEAENFIDTFRLGARLNYNPNPTPNLEINQVIVFFSFTSRKFFFFFESTVEIIA